MWKVQLYAHDDIGQVPHPPRLRGLPPRQTSTLTTSTLNMIGAIFCCVNLVMWWSWFSLEINQDNATSTRTTTSHDTYLHTAKTYDVIWQIHTLKRVMSIMPSHHSVSPHDRSKLATRNLNGHLISFHAISSLIDICWESANKIPSQLCKYACTHPYHLGGMRPPKKSPKYNKSTKLDHHTWNK